MLISFIIIRWSYKNESPCYRWVAFCLFALAITIINLPLARFPSQDLLENDFLLLAKSAWAKAAWLNHPFASLDFLQGLGSNARLDVKVIPHLFDPGVLLSLIFNDFDALWIRTWLLNFYCLICLDKLVCDLTVSGTSGRWFRFPCLFFYILSPQLLHDISHYFSVFFLVLPGLILAIRKFVSQSTWISAITLLLAITLSSELSDLNVFFLLVIIGAFICLFDPVVQKHRARFGVVVLMSFAVLLPSYLGTLKNIFTHGDQVVAVSGMGPGAYWDAFLKGFVTTVFVPVLSRPISAYITPYIPVLVLPLIFARQNPQLAKRLIFFTVMLVGVFLIGPIFHGIPFFARRLPSVLRYHVTVDSFLTVLWIIYHARELGPLLQRIRERRLWLITFAWAVLFSFLTLNLGFGLPHLFRFIIFNSLVFGESYSFTNWLVFSLATFYPCFFTGLSLLGDKTGIVRARDTVVLSLIFIFIGASYYAIRCILQKAYVDIGFKTELNETLPKAIDQIIRHSSYATAPRSLVPIAKGFLKNEDRGYNDKFIGFIDYPEVFGGRSFYQFRYSASGHSIGLYRKASDGVNGQTTIFPPTQKHTKSLISFAVDSQSPFILSADEMLVDDRVELLGAHTVRNPFLDDFPGAHEGLTGTVFVYGVRALHPAKKGTSFKSAVYSRVKVEFELGEGAANEIKLPVTYFTDLRVVDEHRRPVGVWKGSDGYAYFDNARRLKRITVSSFSWLSVIALLAPLFGMVPISLMLFKFKAEAPWLIYRKNGLCFFSK